MKSERLRPVKTANYVWCDYHGAIHENCCQWWDEECRRENWRSVYVAGAKGEMF